MTINLSSSLKLATWYPMAGMILLKVEKDQMLVEDSMLALVMAGVQFKPFSTPTTSHVFH